MKTLTRLFNASLAAALLMTSASALAAGIPKNAPAKSQDVILNCRIDNDNLVIYKNPEQLGSEPAVRFSKGKAIAQFQAEADGLGRNWDMVTNREDYISLRNLKTGQNSFLTFTKGSSSWGYADGIEAAASVAMEGLLTISEEEFLQYYGQHREQLLYIEGNKISKADCLVPEYSLSENIYANLGDETMKRAGDDYSKNTEYLEKLRTVASTFKNEEARKAIFEIIDGQEYQLAQAKKN